MIYEGRLLGWLHHEPKPTAEESTCGGLLSGLLSDLQMLLMPIHKCPMAKQLRGLPLLLD